MVGFTKRLIQAIAASESGTPDACHGCTAREIEEVAAANKSQLPAVYEEFLRSCGRGAGRFWEGTDAFYPTLLELPEWAATLLAEDGAGYTLPPGAIVFAMHQGYQFHFILVEEGEDPPVYTYLECAGAPKRLSNSLSSFLLAAASHVE